MESVLPHGVKGRPKLYGSELLETVYFEEQSPGDTLTVLHGSETVRVGVARSDRALRDSINAIMLQSLILSQAVPVYGGPVVFELVGDFYLCCERLSFSGRSALGRTLGT